MKFQISLNIRGLCHKVNHLPTNGQPGPFNFLQFLNLWQTYMELFWNCQQYEPHLFAPITFKYILIVYCRLRIARTFHSVVWSIILKKYIFLHIYKYIRTNKYFISYISSERIIRQEYCYTHNRYISACWSVFNAAVSTRLSSVLGI